MGISIWQLLIILLIVMALFGTKKLRHIGADLGAAIKNFRQSVQEGEQAAAGQEKLEQQDDGGRVIDVAAGKERERV